MRNDVVADVAIVGLGPVGSTMANLCGGYGLSAVAFERDVDVYAVPRAVVMDEETQRVFDDAGLLGQIAPDTAEETGAWFVDAEGRRLQGYDLPPGFCTPQGYPPIVSFHQPTLERVLRQGLGRYGDIDSRQGHEVTDVSQDDETVRATVRDLNSGLEQVVSTRWLLACDGARSIVRARCSVGWESLGYDHEWLVVDVRLTRLGADLPSSIQQICDRARPTTFVPMPDPLRRWEFQLMPGESREEMERPERQWDLLSRWVTPDEAEIVRGVVYRFHATIADRMRVGRVFLLGDAAHQMPPFLGQGMCSGIRDAANLAWKLAALRRGEATDRLLDTYDAERRPHARALVDHSVAVGQLIDAYAAAASGGPWPTPAEIESGYGGSRVRPHLTGGLVIDGDDEWAGRYSPQLAALGPHGDRRLDQVVGPNWAVVGRDDPAELMSPVTAGFWDGLGAKVLCLGADAGPMGTILDRHHAAVIRPDRYICAVTSEANDLDTLTDHIRTRGGLTPVAA